MHAPCLQDISRDMEGDLKVFKIDTDTYPKLASKYRVQVNTLLPCHNV